MPIEIVYWALKAFVNVDIKRWCFKNAYALLSTFLPIHPWCRVKTYRGDAHCSRVESMSVPTNVLPRHVTFTTRIPADAVHASTSLNLPFGLLAENWPAASEAAEWCLKAYDRTARDKPQKTWWVIYRIYRRLLNFSCQDSSGLLDLESWYLLFGLLIYIVSFILL